MSSKEAIQPICTKSNRNTIIPGTRVTPMDLFQDLIHNPSEKGWYFGTGDPEFWKFSERLIVPGGEALDLGSGLGRTSVPFALQGMHVTSYEANSHIAKVMRAVANSLNFPITVQNKDVRSANLEKDIYDTVILGEVFTHFESEKEALDVIDKAIDSVKPGGHIWLRAAGKKDSVYLELMFRSYIDSYMNPFRDPDAEIEEGVCMAPCNCSGEWRMEPHLFFDPVDLVGYIAGSDVNIIHTQVLPESGKANIMYGEDRIKSEYQHEEDVAVNEEDEEIEYKIKEVERTYGLITILGQKIKKNP